MGKVSMKQKYVISVIVLLLISTVFVPITMGYEQVSLSSKPQQDLVIDRIINLLMRLGHFPSLSTCIISNDQVVWSKAYGYSDLDLNTPATNSTKYMACSISKTFTGMALMQLFDQGLFALDDDVNAYLPFSLRNPHFPDVYACFWQEL